MNAPITIVPVAGPAIAVQPADMAHRVAEQAIHAWRGEIVNQFARAERAVSETLIALAAAAPAGVAVPMPHLVGQKVQALADLLAPGGGFAAVAKGAAKAIERFRVHDPLRAAMTHGHATAAIEASGAWIAIFRFIQFRGDQADHLRLYVCEDEADGVLAAVRRDGQALGSVLGNVRQRLVTAGAGA